jgi:hypothetical protein
MHQRNFKSIHGAKRSRIRWKYLEMRKNRLGERRHRFLGRFHPRTPRFHGGTKEMPMGVLGSPSQLFLCVWEREKWEKWWRGKFCSRSLNSWKPDSPVFPGQPKSVFDNLSLFQGYTWRFNGLRTMEWRSNTGYSSQKDENFLKSNFNLNNHEKPFLQDIFWGNTFK